MQLTSTLPIRGTDQVAVIDHALHGLLSQRRWGIINGYVGSSFHGKTIYLHRCVAELVSGRIPDGWHVHHVRPGDTLDNRASNLKVIDAPAHARLSNLWRRPQPGRFKGVTPAGSKWSAQIRIGDRVLYLGTFEDPETAAKAFDKAARELWGDQCFLNFEVSNGC